MMIIHDAITMARTAFNVSPQLHGHGSSEGLSASCVLRPITPHRETRKTETFSLGEAKDGLDFRRRTRKIRILNSRDEGRPVHRMYVSW